MKILHVLGSMNVGGAETWLMHVLRNIDRTRFHVDFLVQKDIPGAYDDEVRSLGAKIIPCHHPSKPFLYRKDLLRILQEHGPYDVVHSHVHHFSGYVLKIAHEAGVPIRIAHSHNDTSSAERKRGLLRQSYLRLTEWFIQKYATHGLACSDLAAVDLFGPIWQQDARFSILYCGIDLTPFVQRYGKKNARELLGIPQDALVVGHVGRFSEQKNHTFLLDVFSEAVQREPNTHLILLGDGDLRESITKKAADLGCGRQVHLLGVRNDVARCMEAMDVFVLPSLYEGLPLVMIEAQAAGLPCVISTRVTELLAVCPELVTRLPLTDSPESWASCVLSRKADLTQQEALARINASSFSIDFCLKQLLSVYLGADVTCSN